MHRPRILFVIFFILGAHAAIASAQDIDAMMPAAAAEGFLCISRQLEEAKDAYSIAEGLLAISGDCITTGNYNVADQLMRKVLTTAAQIRNDYLQSVVFFKVCAVYLKMGRHNDAREAARAIAFADVRRQALELIALSYASHDDEEGAFDILKRLNDSLSRAIVLYQVARDSHDKIAARAQSEINKAPSRVRFYIEGVRAQNSLKMSPAAGLVSSIPDSNVVVHNILRHLLLAEAAARTGETAAAGRILDGVMEAMGKRRDLPPSLRNNLLAAIAACYTDMRHFDKACGAIRMIGDASARSLPLMRAARGYVSEGRIQEAFGLEQEIEGSFFAENVYKAIARHYLDEGADDTLLQFISGIGPDMALQRVQEHIADASADSRTCADAVKTARLIKDPLIRSRALSYAAAAAHKKGMLDSDAVALICAQAPPVNSEDAYPKISQ